MTPPETYLSKLLAYVNVQQQYKYPQLSRHVCFDHSTLNEICELNNNYKNKSQLYFAYESIIQINKLLPVSLPAIIDKKFKLDVNVNSTNSIGVPTPRDDLDLQRTSRMLIIEEPFCSHHHHQFYFRHLAHIHIKHIIHTHTHTHTHKKEIWTKFLSIQI